MIAVLGDRARDAAVERVDRAADRLAPEQQRGRPAEDLDPFGDEGIDRDGVIDRSVRDVECPDPVGQNPDTLALKAT